MLNKEGKLKLGSEEFQIKSARLSLIFYDASAMIRDFSFLEPIPSLRLFIEIRTLKKPCGYESLAPNLYHNNGISVLVHSWKELEDTTYVWNSNYNERGEEAGYIYITEHESLTSGEIYIGQRKGNTFDLKWTGKVILNINKNLTGEVSIDCSCNAILESPESFPEDI